MNFVYKHWDHFCRKLQEKGRYSIPACEVNADSGKYLVLKHDVETDVSHAFKIAEIEQRYGHRGSYYVQAYLLEKEENVALLKQMQQMGHEISYHYDVMDSCNGNLEAAMKEFEKNCKMFENKGFPVITVCQHGNPIVERNGYHSNRDFFRNAQVQTRYPKLSDIMVNYKEQRNTEYLYFSDAGRMFKLIYDPINNDIVNSDDKNVPFTDLEALLEGLSLDIGNIISIHPHRWTNSETLYVLKHGVFKGIKTTAKLLVKVPALKKIMSRYYYLAKKI